MPGATREAAAAIYRLPLSGSVFRKVFYNPLLGTLEVRFLESQDFVKPYLAVDLQSAQRYTHIVKLPRNDVNKLMALGYYLDEDLGSPDGGVSRSVLDRSIDEATGVSSNGMGASEQNPHEADEPDELYEMSVFLDLSDYGWDDPMGESVESRDGKRRISIGLPYRVTVHTGKQVTLEVRRDWREQDFRKRRRRNVAEYRFLPGFGGYGFGLLHIAGGLADSQTGLLRYLQDGCTLDTVGRLSGWVSQNMMGQRSLPPLKLGEFLSIPSTTDDWNKSVMRPDFQWRTDNTVNSLEYLDGLLDELVSATNTMVGDGDKNVPVGTMLARIEQGSKPFAAIFSLLHESLKDELRAVAEMAADYLPERYPYAVEGADSEVFASDFDARVDVVPISDPNVVSPTQRQAQAQVVVEQNGALFDRNPSPETWGALLAAHEYLLEVIRVPGRERFVPPLPAPAPPGPEQADPAETEAAAEVARKDAAAIAEQQRKDWVAQQDAARKTQQQEADVAGKASAMATDTSAQRMGDQAIIARDQATDIDEMTRDILARAREQQMAQQANVAPEVIT
jgi:hypothetical protein